MTEEAQNHCLGRIVKEGEPNKMLLVNKYLLGHDAQVLLEATFQFHAEASVYDHDL